MADSLTTFLGDAAELRALGRFALALLFGGLLGLEREMQGKPAGLRTHMLIAGAAALLVSVGLGIVDEFEKTDVDSRLRVDPIRVIEAVVAGVSFLGAGTILRSGGKDVEGLTTAASVLLAASIGVCVGTSQILLALGATLGGLFVLRVILRIETLVAPNDERGRGP